MAVNLSSAIALDRRSSPPPVVSVERRRAFAVTLHQEVAAIAPLWRRLEVGGASTAYQHLDWIEGVSRHLAQAEGATPLFAEVTCEGRTVLLMPLALRRRGALRVVEWLDFGVCDYAAPLVAPGYQPSPFEADAVFTAVRAALPKADLISIQRIPEHVGTVPNPLSAVASARPMGLEAFGLPIEGEADTIVARVANKSLERDLRRDTRRLTARGAVEVVQAQSEDEVEAIFAALVAQRRQRFKAVGRFDLLARPEVERFYRDGALQGARGQGPVRLFGLRVGTEWVACAYVLVDRRSLYGILLSIGGDEWRNASPGLQMVARLLEWSRTNGLGYFDMTVGDLPYKARFGAERRLLKDIVVPLTARGIVALAVMRTGAAAKRWMEERPKLFERARTMRQALRKAWR